MNRTPVVLLILDGFGLREETGDNAVAMAETPHLDRLMKECPFVKGYASGLAVGLPDGQMGNSEVGHLNMGAGRIIYQELTRISHDIETGAFFENRALLQAAEYCRSHGSALHLMGLLSDGGVHSHLSHLGGLLELARRQGLRKVYIHCFMDGRDTPPESGIGYVRSLEQMTKEYGAGTIASVCGRYYAMDRDKNWERTREAYEMLTEGKGCAASSAEEIVKASYEKGIFDEFIHPSVIVKDGKAVGTVEDDDAVIFFNFRPDRARQITRAFCDDAFEGFARGKRPKICYTCFTDYDPTIENKSVAFQKETIRGTLGEVLSEHGLRQLRIAETEKYAHVTFFFNGGSEVPNPGEERILIPSPKDVPTYDLKPEMSLKKVCERLCEEIGSGHYEVIICNFANPDMVGHTGVMDAAVRAIEAVDHAVGEVLEAVDRADGQLLICADHGNADMMKDEKGEPFTAHTTSPVPLILYRGPEGRRLREGGVLADIAPTVLELLGLEQPPEMTGTSLLV